MPINAPDLFSYPRYWAECFGTAPYLPVSREEMDNLGWDSCDIIIVTGDAYVDHPSFGMAVVGRFMESLGYRVGIISQPDWTGPDDFKKLGKPNLFFGVAAGNMDSMINHYTADLKKRSDDVYTPNGEPGKRPDRAVTVYSQRCRQAYKDVPIYIGGIEASLRRIAQYDYWTNEVRRSVLVDSGADMLIYGNAERAMAELAHRIASGEPINEIDDIRGTVVLKSSTPAGWTEIDSSRIDWPRNISSLYEAYGGSPYECKDESTCEEEKKAQSEEQPVRMIPLPVHRKQELDQERTCIRMPSFEKVSKDPALYAHASRILHQESNPHNARVLVQKHDNREVWVNPPPIPLETPEIDGVFGLPFQRRPHPSYGNAQIPAFDMIKTSVNIMRGCFGGCSFCSITEHEGRIIQSRSQESVLQELEDIRDKVPGFTGQISDLGGPTANMYFLNCKHPDIQASCRRLSCVFPGICKNLETSHKQTTELYRRARKVPGIKKIAIASGLRYDLAVEDPEYVKELVTHHVGGYLKIAPEHTEKGTLDLMMKPGMGTYDNFKKMFEKFSKEAGKKQYLIPYFIAAHPGSTDEDMMNLGLWLKKNGFRVDQVQTFYPSPMSLATAMYHSGRNPLKKVSYKNGRLFIPREYHQRRLHKAFLRHHDEKNYDLLRKALTEMGRTDLIGDKPFHLVPAVERQRRQGQKRGGQGGRPPARTGQGAKAFQKARGGQWDSRKPSPHSKRKSSGKAGSGGKPVRKSR
ncbi:YgiQ family radical SAM protein [Sansalvadorimonas sp. 2012CJ34-2]|uniref:YgiQ family radical SAM protein n=1 Tax=Parendozoicomonas callyspongiae TaxID=2942213 RepID=A0ABT0PBD9_9GAMM|nr:YgiQ family radical SAM protein [Sansalvadorimonas sp. 2012CJ34-2]MCL6268698.1 YgiQ family radical SAM protein [Sansalvadorimonas sp. 2012CJ34-2]